MNTHTLIRATFSGIKAQIYHTDVVDTLLQEAIRSRWVSEELLLFIMSSLCVFSKMTFFSAATQVNHYSSNDSSANWSIVCNKTRSTLILN